MSSAPPSPSPVTRTLAIIKPHAVKHRLTIEHRIVEAGFEIIKERQMQFDPDGDRDTLLELFGRDADSLGLEPVWVYVLERRRAVEVWLTLMGDEDPLLARQESPNSLRAVYGHDKHDNAFIGSPDTATAETQISVLFASSPPFPTAEADYDVDPMSLSPPRHHSSARSVTSEGKSSHTAASSKPRYTNGNGNGVSPPGSAFKARPVPSTNAVPESQPRLTRAASLRLGLPVEGGHERPPVRAPRTKEEQKAAFLDVPGHKRSQTITVASTAAPTVAPRPTRASVLRENKDQLQRTPTWGSARKDSIPTMDKPKPGQATFDGVPGHKRRETIQVASTAAPTVAPRPNRAAELRALKRQSMGMAPPSSFKSAAPTPPAGPTRRSSTTSLSEKSNGSSTSSSATLVAPGTLRRASSALGTASAPRSSSSLGAPKKPEIEPRTNRSALLRAKAGTPTPGRNGFK